MTFVLPEQHVRIACHVLLGVAGMEAKTEADSHDIAQCSHNDKPTIGMLVFISAACSLQSFISVAHPSASYLLSCSLGS